MTNSRQNRKDNCLKALKINQKQSETRGNSITGRRERHWVRSMFAQLSPRGPSLAYGIDD